MQKRKDESLNIEALRHLLSEILTCIKDEQQNLKDCTKTLNSIQKILEPEKKTLWKRMKERLL